MSATLSERAKLWVEQTNAQVARELGTLQEGMLERVDRLAAELANAQPHELAEVEGVQAYAESFLVDAGQLLEQLAIRLETGLAERLEPLLERAESAGEAGVEARQSVARWTRDARHYLTFVAQYLAGYIQGGGVALGLMLEMPDGLVDRAVVTSIIRHRLMFAADRAEIAATRWAEEVATELVQVARRLDGGVAAVEAPPASDAREPEADRLRRLLAFATELGVKVKQVPAAPSHAWLDKMEEQLHVVAAKRSAQAQSSNDRAHRLKELLAFADQLKVKLKQVPENPSDVWLDKMEQKLGEVAASRNVPVPKSFDDATEDAVATADRPPERQTAPTRISPAERRKRIDEMMAKAKQADLDLGKVPEEPTDQWIEGTEQRLEKALEQQKNERKAARDRKKRERDARIARLVEDARELGLDLGPVPKFPTEDWLARMEMKVASTRLPSEEDLSGDDRAERLAAVLAKAKQMDVELGEVPPDPDQLWLMWAEGRVDDAQSGGELIAAGEDPEDEPARRARLVFEEGTVQERVWVMEERELTIGRARGNAIQVRDDSGVSRLHCTLFEADGQYFLRDNGSTKGTLVDDRLVSDDTLLRDGARITVGDTHLVFRL